MTIFFFFSSRRRHTRYWRDWSSDVCSSDLRVGLASVYRALDVLTGLGLVHRVDVDGTARYEPADPTGDHHHHAICDRCGRMSPFADEDLERLVHAVGERLGYAVDAHDIVLRGACPDCAR